MDAILSRPVHARGGTRPFGELTVEDVRERAAERHWDPTAGPAPDARAWAQLARRMERAGAATVADLDNATIRELAGSIWESPDVLT